MNDDRIESIWRTTMRSSADRAPMEFARALVAAAKAAGVTAGVQACVDECNRMAAASDSGDRAQALRSAANNMAVIRYAADL